MTETTKRSRKSLLFLNLIASGLLALAVGQASAQSAENQAPQVIDIDWGNVVRPLKTEATLQAVVTPLMSPDSPLHGQVWSALKDLNAPFVRYVPWLPYPNWP